MRIQDDQFQIVGAGMPPLFYFNYKKKIIEEIESSGPPLGGFPNFNYEINLRKFSKGDIFVLMSDGFAERLNENKEIYGWGKERELLSTITDLTADQIIKEFINVSDEWGGKREQDDDITLVVLKAK